jgi:hypothetical protein
MCGADCDQVEAIRGWYSREHADRVLEWFRGSPEFAEVQSIPHGVLPAGMIAFRCKACGRSWAWYLADGSDPGGVMRYPTLDKSPA